MRKIFTFLFAALMSAASMWAQTETLLTTITATGVEQANYSTEGVATVSFSHTAGGSSAYIALWGWWGYGWSATVNAAEGYTITKCVFYDDQDRTATDSEAPFVVETTEEDKTPKVNGTPIMADRSKGIKKIDVYGYENPTTVAVTGVTLNQSEAQMTVGGETLTLTATVNPNNATNQSVSWSTSDANVATVENGVVTAVAAGNATITVTTTDGSFTATCAVTVTAPEPQVERELTKLGFNFPSENIPADNDIEMAGTFEEGTMWMEKIIATGWFVSYDFVNAAEDETFKLRSKSNNDLVLCQFIPANNGEGGKWVQAIFTFGNYWSDDTWKGTPCKLIEEDLSDAAQYAWMEGMPEPLPTGIEHIVLTEKAQKVIMNGMVYIVRDGKLFNLTGAQVK